MSLGESCLLLVSWKNTGTVNFLWQEGWENSKQHFQLRVSFKALKLKSSCLLSPVVATPGKLTWIMNHRIKAIRAGRTFGSHLVQFTAQRELASKLDYVFQELVQSNFECPQGLRFHKFMGSLQYLTTPTRKIFCMSGQNFPCCMLWTKALILFFFFSPLPCPEETLIVYSLKQPSQ